MGSPKFVQPNLEWDDEFFDDLEEGMVNGHMLSVSSHPVSMCFCLFLVIRANLIISHFFFPVSDYEVIVCCVKHKHLNDQIVTEFISTFVIDLVMDKPQIVAVDQWFPKTSITAPPPFQWRHRYKG